MELNNIENLLDKYLKAETTLEEEKILKEYFVSGNVAPHLQEMSSLFIYTNESKKEVCEKVIKLKPNKKINFKWMSIAASVLLVVSAFVGEQQYSRYQQRKQFKQIEDALKMVSINLNKGNDAVYVVSSNLNKGSDAINELNIFNKTINKASRILNK